jgi:hypothetical protein
MSDFRTSTQRERWIFQKHDLVTLPIIPSFPWHSLFSLLRFGTAAGLF